MQDYYSILGLTRDASDQDIRTAYKTKCLECHPDLHGDCSTDDFLAIARAYDVLSDPAKRSEYDRELRRRNYLQYNVLSDRVRVMHDFDRYSPNPDEILDHFIGVSTRNRPKSGRVQHLTVEIILDDEESLYGGVLPLDIPVYITCPECDGTGRILGFVCSRCYGDGKYSEPRIVAVPIPPGVMDRTVLDYPLDEIGVPYTMLSVLVRSSL